MSEAGSPRHRVWRWLDAPDPDRAGRRLRRALAWLILLNVLAVVLESVGALRLRLGAVFAAFDRSAGCSAR